MHYGRIAAVEPAIAYGFRCRIGIVVVAGHHHIAAHADLAQGLAIVRHLIAVVVHHNQLAHVISSTPWRDLIAARSRGASWLCSGNGSQIVINGEVSVSPYTCVSSQPNSHSIRSIVAARRGAPAANRRTPRRALRRRSSG